MTAFIPGAGRAFRPATDDDFIYQLAAIVGYDDFNGSTASVTVKDANITRTTSDYSDPYYDIQIRGDDSGVVLTVLDATGELTGRRLDRVSNGNCRVQSDSFLKRAILNCDMTRINGNVYDELSSYVTGSLARQIYDSMIALVGSKTAESKPIFSLQNHTTPTYVRNTDCWAYPVNLTGISPWNSRGANTRAGTAITPRHTIQAAHYPLVVSDTIRFVAADNTVVTRTVSGVQSIANSDIQIALLDSDLPASITPLKFAPANLYSYLPSLELFTIPVFATDYEEKIFIKETCPTCWDNAIKSGTFRDALTEPFSRLAESIISGDSGNPVCMIVNNAPVIISHWLGPSTGPLYHTWLTEIASALTTLGGGHTLSTVDLSAFPTY